MHCDRRTQPGENLYATTKFADQVLGLYPDPDHMLVPGVNGTFSCAAHWARVFCKGQLPGVTVCKCVKY